MRTSSRARPLGLLGLVAVLLSALVASVGSTAQVGAATTDIGFRRSAGEISETAFMGIYDCEGVRCLCADLAADAGGAEATYSYSTVSTFQKQDGWAGVGTNLGLGGISASAPWTTAAEINQMSWAMSEYTDTTSKAEAAALEHFIRVRTVGSPAQVARQTERWNDTVANQPAAATALASMNSRAGTLSGPYTVPVTLNSTGVGAVSGFVTVLSASGAGVPGRAVTLATSSGTLLSTAGTTDANGRVPFAASGVGYSVEISATASVPAGDVVLAVPTNDPLNQRMLLGSPLARVTGSDSIVVGSVPLGRTQISNQAPVVGETITDTLFVEGMTFGATGTWQLQLFNLTDDPAGTTPLVDVTLSGLGNGEHPGLAPYRVTHDGAGDLFGYRERLLSTTDGAPPGAWSELGIANESGTAGPPATAEVHLRKSVSDDSETWINAQGGAPAAHAPQVAPAVPADGSFNNGTPDVGDGLPVYVDGASVSFRYEVWLDDGSTGFASWGDPFDRVMIPLIDDNGTPDDDSDDFAPVYVGGDLNGNLLLEPGEVWIFEALDQRVATAGEAYVNMAAIPDGNIHYPEFPDIVNTDDRTTPREDPAGYQVPLITSAVADPADGDRFLQPEGGVLVDNVPYEMLAPGQEYVLDGEVYRFDGNAEAVATGWTATETFVAQAASGSVDMMFNVPAEPGDYVVFQTLRLPGGEVVATHADPDAVSQQFRVRRPLAVTTQACANEVSPVPGLGVISICDNVRVMGDPGDRVAVTITPYPVIDDVRVCTSPGPATSSELTLDATGVAEWRTPMVVVTAGEWEFIEEAVSLLDYDDRTASRDCETSERIDAETVRMAPEQRTPAQAVPAQRTPAQAVPAQRTPAGTVATTGTSSWMMIASIGSLLVMIGGAMALASRHRVASKTS